MEWILLIAWLSIINSALASQYILNWMGNQPKFTGGEPITVSPGIMTWWREISKFLWAFIAVLVELIRGKHPKYLWPGMLSMVTIMICGFTGVIENIGFFYLPKYYSPHLYAPYVNVYLAFLPFFGKLMFNAPIRKEHWIGIFLVVLGLAVPHLGNMFSASHDPKSVLDFNAILWIIIINLCLCSQQVLNNKTVQTAKPNVGPNALVLWREIWKLVFITSAIFIFPLIAAATRTHIPDSAPAEQFERNILSVLDRHDQGKEFTNRQEDKKFLLSQYTKEGEFYLLDSKISPEDKIKVKTIMTTHTIELKSDTTITVEKTPASVFEGKVIAALDKDNSKEYIAKQADKEFLLKNYTKNGDVYLLSKNISTVDEEKIIEIMKTYGYSRFFSLFEGTIIPNNWWPILFVVAAGLTGYIYSFGFFKLSKFAAHFWVPYTNIWLAVLPFIMLLFGKDVTVYQIIGAVVVTAGLMVGVSDYSRNKVQEIKKKYADE